MKRCIFCSTVTISSVLTSFMYRWAKKWTIFCSTIQLIVDIILILIYLPNHFIHFNERWGRKIVERECVKDKMRWKRPITYAYRQEMRSCSEISRTTIEDSTALLVHYTRPVLLDLSSHSCPPTRTCWFRQMLLKNSWMHSDCHIVNTSITNTIEAENLEKGNISQ